MCGLADEFLELPALSNTFKYMSTVTHTHNCQTFTRWPSPPVLIKEDGIRSALQWWNLYSWVHYMTGTSSMQQNHYMIYPALTSVEHSLLFTSQKLTHSQKNKIITSSTLHHPKLSTTKGKRYIYIKNTPWSSTNNSTTTKWKHAYRSVLITVTLPCKTCTGSQFSDGVTVPNQACPQAADSGTTPKPSISCKVSQLAGGIKYAPPPSPKLAPRVGQRNQALRVR